MNIISNDFFLGWTGWMSKKSKGLSRVFSNTTVQKYQFFGAQPSLWSNSYIHTYWKNHSFDYKDLCCQSDRSVFEYAVEVCRSFPSKEQVPFNFMAVVTVHSDFGAQENEVCRCFHCFLSICHEVMGPEAMILVF